MNFQKPLFLIIGTQKGGTTSLYQYLLQHPQVQAAQQKEVHFFDLNYDLGEAWYLDQFLSTDQLPSANPTISNRPTPSLNQGITGEASPYYLLHPLVPQRAAAFNPEFKLIVLLRDPVDRALSQYYHEVRLGFESLALADAIAQETERLAGELEKFAADPCHQSYPLQHYSYMLRGMYADQIQQWQCYFPTQQLLILNSEKFYEFPQLAMDRVTDFLAIPRWEFQGFQPFNAGSYHQNDPDPEVDSVREYLRDRFLSPNLRLWDYLKVHFPEILDTEFQQGLCWQ
jgi:hypothetical protein